MCVCVCVRACVCVRVCVAVGTLCNIVFSNGSRPRVAANDMLVIVCQCGNA